MYFLKIRNAYLLYRMILILAIMCFSFNYCANELWIGNAWCLFPVCTHEKTPRQTVGFMEEEAGGQPHVWGGASEA